MNLSEICIKRPVLATVLSLVLVVVGVMGFIYLNTRFFPIFQQNSIYVTATYPGASAKLVETSVTTPIEQAISGVEGIDYMDSKSKQGGMEMHIFLKNGFNIYEVSNQIRNKIAIAQNSLPTAVKTPTVKAGWGSMELMDLGFLDPNETPSAIRDYLQRFVINRIEQIPGIANVSIGGANQYAMRIWLNPKKMAAYDIGVNDISTAISNANVELPAGKITADSIDYPITAVTRLKSAKQFGNIILKANNGSFVRLNDVAKVVLGTDNTDKTIVKINDQPGVVLTIFTTADANPITASRNIMRLLNKEIATQLPPGMKMKMSFNQATYMKASVHEVYLSIAIAVLCVALVIFLFLGRMRTVMVPVVTIPVCLVSAFGMMYAFGFTINVITLLALVLAVGLVVDDAIVMMENIYRHIEAGMKPLQAAIKGSKEITFAVVAMTITLAAVYAPIGLMRGQVAHIFASFAFTLAGTVIISGFIALTLSPMMCSRLLADVDHNEKSFANKIEHAFAWIANHYKNLLSHVLSHRLIIIIITAFIAGGGYWLFSNMAKGFMPKEDMGFVISVVHHAGTMNLASLEKQVDGISKTIQSVPGVATTISTADEDTSTSGNNAVFVTLKPFSERSMSAQHIADTINNKLNRNPLLNASTFAPSFGGDMNADIKFYIMGSDSYLQLYSLSKTLIKALKQYPGFTNIWSNLRFNSQQYDVNVNRDLAANAQVSVRSIDNSMANLLGGTTVSTFSLGGRDYDVYMQASDNYLHNIDVINQLNVKSATGQLVPLSNLVTIKPVVTQPTLTHFDRLRAASLIVQLAPGYKLGQGVAYLQQHLPTLLPNNMKYAFVDQARRLLTSNSDMALVFVLAIVFIYLVLAAQFESFLDPIIILLAVPLSIVGALASLDTINGSINIYTAIGLVTLIGLIAKHGILITKFANNLQEQGLSATDALVKAATIRLRPILMTTVAMIFGAIPLVATTGASAHSRQQLGMVIIGGLFFGTFFSLVLVPVMYSYINQWRSRFRKR